MAANNHKRLRTSEEEAPAEGLKGSSIKLALGDLYQETVQLRSDVKELKDDVHNLLKNQSQLSKDLKSIAEILSKSKSKVDNADEQQQPLVQDEVTSDTSEEKNNANGIAVHNDPKSNEQLLDDDDSIDELDDIGRMLQEQGCQTDPVTILPEDITKSNAEMRYDIKSVLHNQTTLASNMKSIFDLIKKHTNPKPYPPKVEVQEPLLIQPISVEQTANNDDVEEVTEVEPASYEIQCIDGPGPSNAGDITLKASPVSLSMPSSGILRPVPKIIPGPYTGTFLVGGDSTLVRDIAEYESILMQIYTKKPHESDNEKARVLLRHLFRMVIPAEILATSNVTGKSRDAVTHRWIRVPKIDEALLLPIFNQTRFQFPEFTDWYTDDKSRTVQYLNNVCKTVRHSSQNPNNKSPTS